MIKKGSSREISAKEYVDLKVKLFYSKPNLMSFTKNIELKGKESELQTA